MTRKARTEKIILFLFFLMASFKPILFAKEDGLVAWWKFNSDDGNRTRDDITGIQDTIEGNFKYAQGVSGTALKLDGFTTRVLRAAKDAPELGESFTVEAWIALGEYPWNWCPVLTTELDEIKGFRLMVGPYGQVSMEMAIGEQWICCTSPAEAIPLRKWMHIAGVYQAGKKIQLYINGKNVSTVDISGSITFPAKSDWIIGMVAKRGKPSDIIRTWGTVETYFGLQGIIDEIKVYNTALNLDRIKAIFSTYTVQEPDLQPHRLPKIQNAPSRFGAYYAKLKYYPEWDDLWPVDQDPDVVVCFDKTPVKVYFWKGTRYAPCWVSENDQWMGDQSLETWNVGKEDTEGCFEHMQDRHCRFSHVRIIENNDARVVVHWRYAPVSSHDNTWRPDPKTGWELWVDEYYYIYPDGAGIRKVSWNNGTTGRNVQFQESLPILQPGEKIEDMLEHDYVQVGDYNYHTRLISFDLRKQPEDWPGNYTVQQFDFKSRNKPFICFEPGNKMFVRSIGGIGYNHYPVGQARCDGRWTKVLDRPSHICSSPLSDPVIHENGNRLHWNALYGMNDMSMADLITLGRSWAYAADMVIKGNDFKSKGHDKSQRCYQIEKLGHKPDKAEIILKGSKDSPVINPAFCIRNWNFTGAKVTVNGKPYSDCRIGINHKLEGDDLVVFIFINKSEPVTIGILPSN